MNLKTYADRDMLALDLADCLASDLENALLHKDRASFAVCGGTSPGPIFDVLSGVSRLDWSRIDVFLTDERWVPETHERSNAALVKARFLRGAAQDAHFLPFFEQGNMDTALAARARALEPCLPVDVMVLGMGTDMHTASLFPRAPGLAEALASNAPVLCMLRPEDQPDIRVSLSGPVIAGALRKHLLIFGDDKKSALEAAQGQNAHDAPICVAFDGLNVHWAR